MKLFNTLIRELSGFKLLTNALLPTALQWLYLIRNPRLTARLSRLGFEAYWERLKEKRKPWSPSVEFNKITSNHEEKSKTVPHIDVEYLRPTWGCDPYIPEIASLAEELGIHKLSKREFAENAYNFVKNRIKFACEWPLGGVKGTLKAGCGMCFHKMSVLVALARYAGIPARYCIISARYAEHVYRATGATQNLSDVIGLNINQAVFGHGYVELYLDSSWVPADVTWDEELEVGMGIPISRLGVNPEGVWCFSLPGKKMRLEGLPAFLSLMGALFIFQNRGVADMINRRYEELRRKGKEVLESLGRDQYIATKRKFYLPNFPEL